MNHRRANTVLYAVSCLFLVALFRRLLFLD
jgi:hypothetical protein